MLKKLLIFLLLLWCYVGLIEGILLSPLGNSAHLYCSGDSVNMGNCLTITVFQLREMNLTGSVVNSLTFPTNSSFYNFTVVNETKYGTPVPCYTWGLNFSNGVQFQNEECLFPTTQTFLFGGFNITVAQYFNKASFVISSWNFSSLSNYLELEIRLNYTEEFLTNQTQPVNNGTTQTTYETPSSMVTVSRSDVGILDGNPVVLLPSEVTSPYPGDGQAISLIMKVQNAFTKTAELDPIYGISSLPTSTSEAVSNSPQSNQLNPVWLAFLIIVIIAAFATIIVLCIKYQTYRQCIKQN